MPKQMQMDARGDFSRRVLPWLLAAAMLLIYAITLNRWVSLSNLGAVARISGWLWSPQLNNPLFYLVTLPFRMLPAAVVPIALNLFSAVCGALTLCLLARSVGLLPRDRTEAQLARERNDFFLLTVRGAWFPPLLAALLCGLQLTFWETATDGGIEMFDLLLFAVVAWLLVEYRMDERQGRLFLSAVIAGAGMVEEPAMLAFFPIYIVAIIWLKGVQFFNLRFLVRMALCGLAGFSLFLLLPLLAVVSGGTLATFWPAIKLGLAPQYGVLKYYFLGVSQPAEVLDDLLMPIFISLMPLLVLSIRWKLGGSIGDTSRWGAVFANLTFHAIHAIFLGVCLWLVFDPPFSPREKGLGLTLYYLIALSAGYYAGYFLLIFGRKHPRARELPPRVKAFNAAVVAAVWLAGILAVAGLAYKNMPLVCQANGNALSQYTSLVVKSLPRAGAIVLSDDPQQLYLTEAALAREDRSKDYLLLDSRSLPYLDYHRYLHKVSPQKWPMLVPPKKKGMLNDIGMIEILAVLNRSNELCYLQPSFGYYFEYFYLQPHGLIYQLKTLPNKTLLPPPLDKNLVAENQSFWAAAQTDALGSLEDTLDRSDSSAPKTFAEKQLAPLRVPHEMDLANMFVGAYYSRAVDFWGVELQRSGDLTNAAQCFKLALRLNPDNVAAQTNLCFNGDLQAGRRVGIDLSELGHVGRFNSLVDAIKGCGPFDEPSFCLGYGVVLVKDNGLRRQAVEPFERVRQLEPDNWTARSWLALIYNLNRLPDRVLDVLRAPLEQPSTFSLSASDVTGLDIFASAAYFQKNDLAQGSSLLETALSRSPTNDTLLQSAEIVYSAHGMFTNALIIANRKLRLSPNNVHWLLAKGYVENQMKNYDAAIATLNGALSLQNTNADAEFQLGNAYLGRGNLDAARASYEKAQSARADSFQIAFGLGEIAWRRHDTNEALRNYEIYLANAPTNTPQSRLVAERFQQLNQNQPSSE